MKNNIKKYGEVHTSQFLVSEMLDTLPPEVWTNPNLKWLDPCVGRNGIFVLNIIDRLMIGLKEFQPNKKLLYQHIVENMLYMAEIQPDAVEELKQLLIKKENEI